jgi:probable HAF family extracellular repeat protein
LENPVATGVSADGAVVVGRTVFGYHGWRWTQATGMVELGMSGGYEYGYATGVSGDGDIIVGSAARVQGDCSCPSLCDPGSPLPETHWAGFHQDHPDGPLHGLDGIDQADSRASGISLDGSTIIGTSVVTDGCYSTTSVQACLWQTSQPIPLGVLPGDSWSNGISVSEDGAVAMGWSFGPGERTFRWTVSGMEDLGSIAGCTSPVGRAISADGSVVVGNCSCNGQYRAFIWNPEDGMRDLRAALVEFGLNLNGWLLIGANGISADGRTIAGSGINPSGQIEAWIAYLGDPLCPGDLDGDGSRSGADIQPFVNCYLSAGSGCAPADVDGNNVLDPGDLTTFLNMLLMSSPCP